MNRLTDDDLRGASPIQSGSRCRRSDPLQRFMDKVEKNAGGCWIWRGGKFRDTDYGAFWATRRKHVCAHRWSYTCFIGPIPEGLTLDHLCRNPPCVNPQHLEPVTQTENKLRGVGITAQLARRTHCNRGHPFDEANTMLVRGYRACRTCNRERLRSLRKRLREERARQ